MSSPGRQSRSPQGWGTQLLSALFGSPRENPNFGKDQETANMEKGGKQVDVEHPYKPAGFSRVFGNDADVRNTEYKISGNLLNKEYGLRGELAKQAAQLARDNFIFENADRIKNIVKENIANKYGITEESHPELYNKYQKEILPGIVNNQFSEQQALQSKAANEAGLANDLSVKTRPTRLQTGLTEANTGLLGAKTGETLASGNLRRQPTINRNLDLIANTVPLKTSLELQKDALFPIGNDRLITLGNNPSITQFPTKEETAMASALGKPAPHIATQPFGSQEGITLSDGTFIPKVGGKVNSPFNDIINSTTPLTGNRMFPSNFSRPAHSTSNVFNAVKPPLAPVGIPTTPQVKPPSIFNPAVDNDQSILQNYLNQRMAPRPPTEEEILIGERLKQGLKNPILNTIRTY